MTKEELREKRNLAIENLNYAIAILGSDELYIDELEKKNAILEKSCANYKEEMEKNRKRIRELLDKQEKLLGIKEIKEK